MALSDAALTFGREVMTALLGLDQLYRRESGDEDGLAVLNLDQDHEFTGDAFESYRVAAGRFADLRLRAVRLPEPDRRVYYDDLCHSTLAFIAWREQGLSFERQLADFLHVPAAPVSEADLDRLRIDLQALLDRNGYQGTLAAQSAEWERRNRVPAADVEAVLTRWMDDAWTRTEATLLPIPADRADGMRVTPVSGMAFNARCNYPGRSVEINTDPVLTGPGLKHLAVHEGCPGHYIQFKMRETWYRRGLAAADVLLSCVNTASSCVFEGIADAGLEMTDWIANDDDRIQSLQNRYRAAVGTVAAWRLHGLGHNAGPVGDWLRSVALVGGEGWVANRMAFIRAPARAALIWSYWWGEPTVAAAWRTVAPPDRPAFLEFLHTRMHSNRSVAMFQADSRR